MENTTASFISKNTHINGDIISKSSIEIAGDVTGLVETEENIMINGTVLGNIHGNDLITNGAKIDGDIECINSIRIGEKSIVHGNITGKHIIIEGAVKGDITAKSSVQIANSAIILGNITTEQCQVSDGASIEGQISPNNTEISPAKLFENI